MNSTMDESITRPLVSKTSFVNVSDHVRGKGKAGKIGLDRDGPWWNDGNEEIQYATSVELRRL